MRARGFKAVKSTLPIKLIRVGVTGAVVATLVALEAYFESPMLHALMVGWYSGMTAEWVLSSLKA